MRLQLLFLLFLVLTSCVTPKSTVTAHDRQTKHEVSSPGIHHITAIKEIAPLLQTLDERDLVVWDVDSVILTSKDMIHRPASDLIRPKVFKEIEEKYDAERVLLVRSRALLQARWELVDELIPTIIRVLQAKNVKTIALTAVRTNGFGQISDPMRWRVDELLKLGVHFNWPTHLEKQVWQDHTGFLDGVVGSGNQPKGFVLLRFLDKAKFKPRTLVFIDDKLENVESVQGACKQTGIENCYGFQFEAETFAKDQTPNPCMLKFQLEALALGRSWPKDQEALENIRNGKFKCSTAPTP